MEKATRLGGLFHLRWVRYISNRLLHYTGNMNALVTIIRVFHTKSREMGLIIIKRRGDPREFARNLRLLTVMRDLSQKSAA